MRRFHLHALFSAAFAVSLPASAQTWGTTRIPPQVQDLKEAPDQGASPDTVAPEASPVPTLPPAGQHSSRKGSQTLGDGSKDPNIRRLENTSAGLAPPGGVMGVDSGPEDERGMREPAAGQAPELHVVQKGDTLWSLCSKYFGDPWRWPRLWAANPSITSPHWIFPGDILRLGGAGGEGSVPFAGGDKAKDSGRLLSSDRLSALSSNAVVLREVGFIEAKDLTQAATVSGSREEKVMLAAGDQAYLRFPKERPLRAGERYTIFETDLDHPVTDPDTGKVYGYLVKVHGDIVVEQIAGADIARGTLTDTLDVIERGARVSSAIRQFRRIEPRPSNVSLEARVVASFTPAKFLSAERFVVLNRGRRDGVQVGNRNFVVRRGDGYRGMLEDWEFMDPESPKEVVGELWVIDVRENASVAWIARSSKELRVGETTEMRKGY
ncbi:MAG TPA: LysM peptidoglycan-binding domain-containing protein [Polyangia bacterium]|nr:LysM peptidoglycan-binding domain-containing protein [Polyangia bacterium]